MNNTEAQTTKTPKAKPSWIAVGKTNEGSVTLIQAATKKELKKTLAHTNNFKPTNILRGREVQFKEQTNYQIA